jgi:hypothetical protein
VDLKNAAFVKMRDSVSFCKQILIEYVLKNLKWVVGPLYMTACWSVRGWRGISHDFDVGSSGAEWMMICMYVSFI